MWTGIAGAPSVAAWYLDHINVIQLPTDWKEPLLGIAVGLVVVALIANVMAHWWSSTMRQQRAGGQPRPFAEQGHVTIDYAGYGLSFGQYRNVTERVRDLMKDGELHMRVNEKSLLCDPYRGQYKHLLVLYSQGNDEGKRVEAGDERIVDLPPCRVVEKE